MPGKESVGQACSTPVLALLVYLLPFSGLSVKHINILDKGRAGGGGGGGPSCFQGICPICF